MGSEGVTREPREVVAAAALALMRERGWRQGPGWGAYENGPLCASEALSAAAYGFLGRDHPEAPMLSSAAHALVCKAAGRGPGGVTSIVTWNDAPGRTFAQVERAFGAAASGGEVG